MQTSYSKNYIKIYFFQILSIVLGFASMFVVIPYLSSNQGTYGIYAVCMSVTIFLSYADLGFLGAGMKYAAEGYAKGDTKKEIEIIGFSHFILLAIILLFSAVFLYLSFNPSALITDLQPDQSVIASRLLLILAIFSPTTVLQRMLQMIFGIRLQEYNLQKINIVGSIIKISSVFYFFGDGRYDIVGYYLFVQVISLLVALYGVWMAKRHYNYNFGLLFKHVKFSKDVFRHTKSLAFSTLFVTISWVLYYELDSLAIGKILGADSVAIYAIGLSILGFLRSLLGVIFSPFSARFNHFIGSGQTLELKNFYQHVITITFPLVVFPLVAIAVMSKGIVISWVGENYQQSIEITQWLVLCNVPGFISYPAGMLLIAREKIKQMYVVSMLMPFVFWGGIFSTISFLGIESFAIFKFLTFLISGSVYLWLSLQFLEVSLWSFFKKTIIPYLLPLTVMCSILWLMQDICIDEKNKLSLLINGAIVGAGIAIAMAISLITCKPLREYAKKLLK